MGHIMRSNEGIQNFLMTFRITLLTLHQSLALRPALANIKLQYKRKLPVQPQYVLVFWRKNFYFSIIINILVLSPMLLTH